MYKISFKKSVAKDLKRLDKTQAKRIQDYENTGLENTELSSRSLILTSF